MPLRLTGLAAHQIEDLFNRGTMTALGDDDLVDMFVSGQERRDAAFRALIDRHGPMVLGICRRMLADEHAAEDAFQATFLVLVKKARSLRNRSLLTNWLYGVALRVCRREKSRGSRHQTLQLHAAEQVIEPPRVTDRSDLQAAIAEEIGRLPEHYRAAIVLCHLEGLRHDEAARRMGCPVGTIESRLSRARDLLRRRLARRGLNPSDPEMTAFLAPGASSWTCPLSPAVVDATIKAAAECALIRSTAGHLALRWVTRIPRLGAFLALGGCVLLAAGLALFQKTGERAPARSPHQLPTASRSPSAYATPLSGITIDGRLDDWPAKLPHYPIRRQLRGHWSYEDLNDPEASDLDAYFMAGYSERDQAIYLAVVVRDDELKVHGKVPFGPAEGNMSAVFETDAVELYLDGAFTKRKIPEPVDGLQALDAATMPVLQYVGVPGEVGAYGDRQGANPALMYRKAAERFARMAYHRQGDVTTYEWSLHAYERYPDKLVRLEPGKRIGLEIAVVDKDSADDLPVYMTWGPPSIRFRALNATLLGELILIKQP